MTQLYTAGYLLTLTFAKTTQSSHILTVMREHNLTYDDDNINDSFSHTRLHGLTDRTCLQRRKFRQ